MQRVDYCGKQKESTMLASEELEKKRKTGDEGVLSGMLRGKSFRCGSSGLECHRQSKSHLFLCAAQKMSRWSTAREILSRAKGIVGGKSVGLSARGAAKCEKVLLHELMVDFF